MYKKLKVVLMTTCYWFGGSPKADKVFLLQVTCISCKFGHQRPPDNSLSHSLTEWNSDLQIKVYKSGEHGDQDKSLAIGHFNVQQVMNVESKKEINLGDWGGEARQRGRGKLGVKSSWQLQDTNPNPSNVKPQPQPPLSFPAAWLLRQKHYQAPCGVTTFTYYQLGKKQL